ncbi:hypothetical protein OKW32_003932 [Paraburkholderia youngii]
MDFSKNKSRMLGYANDVNLTAFGSDIFTQ